MVAPEVVVLIATVCGPENSPVPGVITGRKAVGLATPEPVMVR